MSKFPRLEQMRAARQRREDEVTAPYRRKIDGLQSVNTALRATIRKIEATMGTEIGKHILDYVGAPLYKGMPHYTESLSRYESLGFQLMDMFVVNRTNSGAILEYDCLMARTNRLKPT